MTRGVESTTKVEGSGEVASGFTASEPGAGATAGSYGGYTDTIRQKGHDADSARTPGSNSVIGSDDGPASGSEAGGVIFRRGLKGKQKPISSDLKKAT